MKDKSDHKIFLQIEQSYYDHIDKMDLNDILNYHAGKIILTNNFLMLPEYIFCVSSCVSSFTSFKIKFVYFLKGAI